MKKSPVYAKHEANDYNGYEYNPHEDFSLFLEEAKQNERIKTNSVISQAKPEEEKKKKKKKKKKAWKAFLFPWLKGEKKSDKPQEEPTTSSRASLKMQRGFASGPVFSSSGKGAEGGACRPLSGPLMSSLFTPMRKAEIETPYVCLDKLGSSCPAKNYGPVYLVT